MSASALPSVGLLTVVLRSFVPQDAPKVHAMSQESGLRRVPGSPVSAPYVLAVCLRGSSELIGHVGLSPLYGEVEVGYAIEEKHQGRGFASEAVGTMVNCALQRFDLPRVLGIVGKDNAASCRVLENAGFALTSEAMGSLHGRPGLIRTYDRARRVGAVNECDPA